MQIPSFVRDQSNIRRTVGSLWSAASGWDVGNVPVDSESVSVTGMVYLDTKTARLCEVRVESGGHLHLLTGSELNVQHLVIEEGGTLSSFNTGGAVTKITILDIPIDLSIDPDQLGNGLLARGAVKLCGCGGVKTTWAKFAVAPKAGDTEIRLEGRVAGWMPGDRLIIPDTHQLGSQENHVNKASYRPQWERPKVKSVKEVDDYTLIELEAPLLWSHHGSKGYEIIDWVWNAASHRMEPLFGPEIIEFFPHCGNLTRDIVIQSENARGTRGHCLFTDRADIDIRFVQFQSLGRTLNADPTSKGGRYAVHIHNLLGLKRDWVPGEWKEGEPWQYVIGWCSVSCGVDDHNIKGGIAVHGSFGYIGGNVLYNWRGWGIEVSGKSYYNVIEANQIVRVDGTGSREKPDGSSGPHGTAGCGIWLRSPWNKIRDNVASDIYGGGYSYGYDIDFRDVVAPTYVNGRPLYLVTVPAFPGADPAAGETMQLDIFRTPLYEFSGNKAYGAGPGGLTMWRLGVDMMGQLVGRAGTIKDMEIWNVYDQGVYLYETNGLTFEHLQIRSDLSTRTNRGVKAEDYLQADLTFYECDIRGCVNGIEGPWFQNGLLWCEGCYFDCFNGFVVNTGWKTSGGSAVLPKQTYLNNCRFAPGTIAILPLWTVRPDGNVVAQNLIQVYNHTGVQGDNFRVYFHEQRADFVLPKTGSMQGFVGAPATSPQGMTNDACMRTYGIAACGEVAPAHAVASRPEIAGLIA